MEYAIVNAAGIKVHRHGQGAKGGLKVRLSAVKGGMNTKILASRMRSALSCVSCCCPNRASPSSAFHHHPKCRHRRTDRRQGVPQQCIIADLGEHRRQGSDLPAPTPRTAARPSTRKVHTTIKNIFCRLKNSNTSRCAQTSRSTLRCYDP
ncbi:hypothetical protein ACNJX9_33555 [Bradyrhizobium sp. DASA03076]|uniref:hypothetical protein n=1 Tax=Bradyrhizobium sp. BLXBL-03 TaxID=3395916 RepID=UPI003F6FD8B0